MGGAQAVSGSPLNGPLESGLRVLAVLNEMHPKRADVGRLVLLDHCVLHSADIGGPPSLHPELPIRAGELGIKRVAIEQGLDVMIRVGLITISAVDSGIEFAASDTAGPFLGLLTAQYTKDLTLRAAWVAERFNDIDELGLREEMRRLAGSWEPEFDTVGKGGGT